MLRYITFDIVRKLEFICTQKIIQRLCVGQSCDKLVIMKAVRQLKIMVSKENFKLVSQLKKKTVNTLPLDNHRTSVCCKSVTWSLPISLHSVENTREFRGLALTKLTIFTLVSKTSFKLSGIPLVGRASRWMLQCYPSGSGATDCTSVTTPLCLRVMAFAPSVQTPT